MGRARPVLFLVAYAAAAWALFCVRVLGPLWVGPAASQQRPLQSRTQCRAIIPRPVGSPELYRRQHGQVTTRWPRGSQRLPGPARGLFMDMNITNTLRKAVDDSAKGGLTGRYRDEIIEHLEEMDALRAAGKPAEATVLWDWENVDLRNIYRLNPHEHILEFLEWVAGVVDAPVTTVESAEITRDEFTTKRTLLNGHLNWLHILRQVGGIVHRVWPPMKDAVDVMLLERMRFLLDENAKKPPSEKKILVLLSGDKGFEPMLEAAQSEGTTVVAISPHSNIQYFPGGRNFSVPINIPEWQHLRYLVQRKLGPLWRPGHERSLADGPARWFPGVVELNGDVRDEVDRRRFHHFINKSRFTLPPPSERTPYTLERSGLPLNDTLQASLQRALEQTGMMGTRRGQLPPKVAEAVKRDLEDFRQEGHKAAVFWNFETMKCYPQGPTQQEMLGRVVRFFEGYLAMPVDRVEVSRYVEPWERFGASPQDWLYHMDNLGFLIHRVWPPRAEMTNTALTRGVGALARTASRQRELQEKGATLQLANPLPRVVCVVSDELYFDEPLRQAQRAGITAMWLGPDGRIIYYPANIDARVRITVLQWDIITDELARANMNPFLPGAITPERSVRRYRRKSTVNYDFNWGHPDELRLDKSELLVPLETA